MQDHGIDNILDRKLIAEGDAGAGGRQAGRDRLEDHNYDRTAGAMLSGEVAKRYGHEGLPEDTIM